MSWLKGWAAVGALGSSALLCGCGGLSSGGYLASGSGYAIYIQLTVSGTSLSGTLDDTSRVSTTTNSNHGSFTGTENGSSLTLAFDQGLGVVTNISGSVDGSNLILEFPQTSGTLITTTFVPSNSAAYDSAVAVLDQSAANAQASSAAAQASQQAAAQAAQQAAADQQAVDSASAAVQQDLASLAHATIDTSSFGPDLQAQQKDLATMRADEQIAKQAPDPNTACSDANTVQSDANTVQSDANTVQSDVNSVDSDVSYEQGLVSSLTTDFAALQSAESADSTYQPSGLPTAAEVSTASSTARASIMKAQSIASTDLRKANAVAASAQTEAGSFVNQYCSS